MHWAVNPGVNRSLQNWLQVHWSVHQSSTRHANFGVLWYFCPSNEELRYLQLADSYRVTDITVTEMGDLCDLSSKKNLNGFVYCQYESVSVDLLVIWTTQTVTVNADRTHPNQVYSKGIHYNIEIFHKSSELVLTTSYTLVYTIHIGNFSKVLIQKTLYTLQYNT